MLPIDELASRIQELSSLTTTFEGTAVRALHPRHCEDPFGLGRDRLPAGRFNVAGGPRILYLGDDFYTCAGEAEIISVPHEPIAFLAVDCRLARVVDLREAAVQRLLETNDAELAAPVAHDRGGPTPMQALGAMLVDAGQFDAIFFASARRLGHHCIGVLMDGLTPPSELRVVDGHSGRTTLWQGKPVG
jgi:hypothetical protein